MPRIEYHQFCMMQILSEIYSLAEYTIFLYSNWQNIPIVSSHTADLHPAFVHRAMLHLIINLIFHYLVSSSLK